MLYNSLPASCSAYSTLQRHFTKIQVAAIALAGMAIFPVFFVSSTPIMLLVSAVLGFWWGFLVATIGTAIGMLLAFLVGKQIFHDRLHRCATCATQVCYIFHDRLHRCATPQQLPVHGDIWQWTRIVLCVGQSAHDVHAEMQVGSGQSQG